MSADARPFRGDHGEWSPDPHWARTQEEHQRHQNGLATSNRRGRNATDRAGHSTDSSARTRQPVAPARGPEPEREPRDRRGWDSPTAWDTAARQSRFRPDDARYESDLEWRAGARAGRRGQRPHGYPTGCDDPMDQYDVKPRAGRRDGQPEGNDGPRCGTCHQTRRARSGSSGRREPCNGSSARQGPAAMRPREDRHHRAPEPMREKGQPRPAKGAYGLEALIPGLVTCIKAIVRTELLHQTKAPAAIARDRRTPRSRNPPRRRSPSPETLSYLLDDEQYWRLSRSQRDRYDDWYARGVQEQTSRFEEEPDHEAQRELPRRTGHEPGSDVEAPTPPPAVTDGRCFNCNSPDHIAAKCDQPLQPIRNPHGTPAPAPLSPTPSPARGGTRD
jgi:Zinc knuckle